MAIGGNFLLLWRNYFTVVSTVAFYLVLVVVEHAMDSNFICLPGETLILPYSLFYVFIPPIILVPLGVVFQPVCLHPPSKGDVSKCKKCKRCWAKAFIPALLWIIIMLLDGKYLGCLFTLQKMIGPAYFISQMSGLGLLLLLVGFVCCRYWKTPTGRITMGADQSKTMLQAKAAEYLTNQQNEAIHQLIEKHLKDRYLVAPETFLAALTDEEIAAQIEEGFKFVRETQAPAVRSENPYGRAGSSNGGN